MEIRAELVGRARIPGDPATDGQPNLWMSAARRLVTVRRDDALLAYSLDRLLAGDTAPAATFAAPWPRWNAWVDAVSPRLDLAVFAGQHAVLAVEAGGRTRWEVRHSCWAGACLAQHQSYREYADDPEHRYPDRGSTWVSADGHLVWAHVRGPLPGRQKDPDNVHDSDSDEEWLVLDAADGRIIAREPTDTYTAGSLHIPHLDGNQMGLSVGEGQDGAPMLWGHFDGDRLTVTRFGDDRVLLAATPDGRAVVTLSHAVQDELATHRLPDGKLGNVYSADWLPPSAASGSPAEEPLWHFTIGFVDDTTLVASTSERGHGEDTQHWFIDISRVEVHGPVRYPVPVHTDPVGLGDGTWLTTGTDQFELYRWREVVVAASPDLWGRTTGRVRRRTS